MFIVVNISSVLLLLLQGSTKYFNNKISWFTIINCLLHTSFVRTCWQISIYTTCTGFTKWRSTTHKELREDRWAEREKGTEREEERTVGLSQGENETNCTLMVFFSGISCNFLIITGQNKLSGSHFLAMRLHTSLTTFTISLCIQLIAKLKKTTQSEEYSPTFTCIYTAAKWTTGGSYM